MARPPLFEPMITDLLVCMRTVEDKLRVIAAPNSGAISFRLIEVEIAGAMMALAKSAKRLENEMELDRTSVVFNQALQSFSGGPDTASEFADALQLATEAGTAYNLRLIEMLQSAPSNWSMRTETDGLTGATYALPTRSQAIPASVADPFRQSTTIANLIAVLSFEPIVDASDPYLAAARSVLAA